MVGDAAVSHCRSAATSPPSALWMRMKASASSALPALDDDQLVAADAGAAVGDAPDLRGHRAATGCRAHRITTKSLPSPCILVKRAGLGHGGVSAIWHRGQGNATLTCRRGRH
jgi:hypothetical protein